MSKNGWTIPPAIVSRKPQGAGWRLNTAHPLNKGLAFCCLPYLENVVDIISGSIALPSTQYFMDADSVYGRGIKSSDSNGCRWIFQSSTKADKIAGPFSILTIARNFVNANSATICGSSESVLGNGFGLIFDDVNIANNSVYSFINNGARASAGYHFFGQNYETNWHVLGFSADGINHRFYTVGKSVVAAHASLPTANTDRRMFLSGLHYGSELGIGVIALFIWDRVLSDAEMHQAVNFPFGTPDNPRLI